MIKELIGRHLLAHIVLLGPCCGPLLGTNKCRNRGTVQPHRLSLSIVLCMFAGHNSSPDKSSYFQLKDWFWSLAASDSQTLDVFSTLRLFLFCNIVATALFPHEVDQTDLEFVLPLNFFLSDPP